AALVAGDVVDKEVEAAFIDDSATRGAKAGLANAVAGMRCHLHRLADRAGKIGGDFLLDEVADAKAIADVIKKLAIRAPHRGIILAVEGGNAAVIAAVGVAKPKVVVGGAAVIFAIPTARSADISDGLAIGTENGFAAFGNGNLSRGAAV